MSASSPLTANARLAACYAATYYIIVSGLSKRPPDHRKGSVHAEPTAAGACPALSRAIVSVCPVCGGLRRPGGAGSRPRGGPGFQPRGDRDSLPVLRRLSRYAAIGSVGGVSLRAMPRLCASCPQYLRAPVSCGRACRREE